MKFAIVLAGVLVMVALLQDVEGRRGRYRSNSNSGDRDGRRGGSYGPTPSTGGGQTARCPRTCSSDSDCPVCNGVQSTCDLSTSFLDTFGVTSFYCNTGDATGTTSTTCSSNADCPEGSICSGSVCLILTGTTNPPVEHKDCSTISNPCVDTGFTCNSGVCFLLCPANTCPVPSTCTDGRCERIFCTSDSDCSADQDSVCAPFIDPFGNAVNMCTWPDIDHDDVVLSCTSDTDCPDSSSCNANNNCQVSTTTTTPSYVLPSNWCLQVARDGSQQTRSCGYRQTCDIYSRGCPYVDSNGDAYTVYTCRYSGSSGHGGYYGWW